MADQASGQPKRRAAGKLSYPWIKRQLCRDLALANMTQRELAAKYDCVQSSIFEFAERNAAEITAIRDNAADEYAGLWIADKQNRIAVYAEQVEMVRAELADGDVEDRGAGLMRVAQAALKGVAEELGQLTVRTRSEVSADVLVRSEVVGVDPADI